MGFIDEYRLLFTLEAKDHKNPAVLVMMDTENPDRATTTTFCLPRGKACRNAHLVLENDAHREPRDMPMTSFCDDPEQRLIVLLTDCGRYLVFPVGALLEHYKAGKDSKIEWDMWGKNVATPSNLIFTPKIPIDTWVSGCRLFARFDCAGQRQKVCVYDFSWDSQGRHLESKPNSELGGVPSLGRAGEAEYPQSYRFVGGTRDSLIVFTGVSATDLFPFWNALNNGTFGIAAW